MLMRSFTYEGLEQPCKSCESLTDSMIEVCRRVRRLNYPAGMMLGSHYSACQPGDFPTPMDSYGEVRKKTRKIR